MGDRLKFFIKFAIIIVIHVSTVFAVSAVIRRRRKGSGAISTTTDTSALAVQLAIIWRPRSDSQGCPS
jgi:hypothetical protein